MIASFVSVGLVFVMSSLSGSQESVKCKDLTFKFQLVTNLTADVFDRIHVVHMKHYCRQVEDFGGRKFKGHRFI